MNTGQSYMAQPHDHSGSYTPQSQTSMSQYSQYAHPAPSYTTSPSSYNQSSGYQYSYPGSVTSPQGNQGAPAPMSSLPHLPVMSTGPGQPNYGAPGSYGNQHPPAERPFDTTGQIAPPGAKPRVTATLWEDEGSLCFQVEANGMCVARREDNHMINGTKLLNVAGMTRGRRDGILKSEKHRHVVKIGPMHLKGVWIPFERALDFANREKITEKLYPLFVNNISALLYHPQNNRNNVLMGGDPARRGKFPDKTAGNALVPMNSQPPPLHHHHSMNGSLPSQTSQPHSIAPHPGVGRPGLDRAHTFPTPPASASSQYGSQAPYSWDNQNMPSGMPPAQPLALDAGMNASRSMPSTPATTPPGNSIQGISSYAHHPPYEGSRPMYSSSQQQGSQYAPHVQQNVAKFGHPMQSNMFIKSDMGPPQRTMTSGSDADHHDVKADPYSQNASTEHHGVVEELPDDGNDHDYSANADAPYNYSSNHSVGGIRSDQAHLAADHLNGSPAQGAGSGYNTPPNAGVSNQLYNGVTSSRNSTDNYGPSAYAPTGMNGQISNKRARDDDDDDYKPGNESEDSLKRLKTGRNGSIGVPNTSYSQPISTGQTTIIRGRR